MGSPSPSRINAPLNTVMHIVTSSWQQL